VKRRDKNAKIQQEAPMKTLKRRDKNTKAKQEPAKKNLSRRDKNTTSSEPVEKKNVKQADKMQQTSSAEKNSKGIKRTGKVNQSGVDRGFETPKKPGRKGSEDPNKVLPYEEINTKGLNRSGKSLQQSDPFVEPSSSKKKAGKPGAGAFSQTSHKIQAKPKVLKRNPVANRRSSQEKNVSKGARRKTSGVTAQAKSHDIFTGESKEPAPKVKKKNTSHLQSSTGIFG